MTHVAFSFRCLLLIYSAPLIFLFINERNRNIMFVQYCLSGVQLSSITVQFDSKPYDFQNNYFYLYIYSKNKITKSFLYIVYDYIRLRAKCVNSRHIPIAYILQNNLKQSKIIPPTALCKHTTIIQVQDKLRKHQLHYNNSIELCYI